MPAADAETTPLSRALGRRVEQERRSRNLTKEELAERSGLASRYLWRVEAGRQNTTLKVLAALARGLGLTVSKLTLGVEEMAARESADVAEARQP